MAPWTVTMAPDDGGGPDASQVAAVPGEKWIAARQMVHDVSLVSFRRKVNDGSPVSSRGQVRDQGRERGGRAKRDEDH